MIACKNLVLKITLNMKFPYDLIYCSYREICIGIDTENESVYSYKGYLCLIQLSTLDSDYVIDLLAIDDNSFVSETLGKQILENDSIIKVLHGGTSDKIWIHRDFGINIKNIFDTQDIYRQIGGKRLALNHLWSLFCNFEMDNETKIKFQTSKWSQRPIPSDMLSYAANDSRYLLSLRYKLLCIALNGPDEGILSKESFLRGPLKLKNLTKLYQKMQKEDLLRKHQPITFTKLLYKMCKSDKKVDLDTIFRFKAIYEECDEYFKANDINPDCIIDYKHCYHCASLPSQAEEFCKSLENIPIRESLKDHRSNILRIISEIAIKEISEEHLSDESIRKIHEELAKKLILDAAAREKEAKKKIGKQERRQRVIENFSLKKPIYENCMILAPDSQILCKCDKKKVEWYLERGLAEKISDEPLTIKLNFEPSGRGIKNFNDERDDDEFYVEERSNICVACGSGENYVRHQIIPAKFRIFFPEKYKSHRSHDVLLLCFNCNEMAIKKQAELEHELSEKFNVPMKVLNTEAQGKETLNLFLRKPRSIIRGEKKIPEERLLEMYKDCIEEARNILEGEVLKEEQHESLKEFLSSLEEEPKEIDFQFLKGSLKFKPRHTSSVATKRQNIYGKLIIEKYGGNDKIPDFIMMWRQFFLDNLEPKYLPKNWSVGHSIERVFGAKSLFYHKEDD
ncbi:unnamed protein product [Moneuplotes crassus]|uniref:3'-5' exonuclease domain-containing protein n=1 Tax=Euplotes crassus TaxID=5936 RepID=A0AAD1Y699_EUPCR|nr:unnamed protein product [Moneuplotes crassus]